MEAWRSGDTHTPHHTTAACLPCRRPVPTTAGHWRGSQRARQPLLPILRSILQFLLGARPGRGPPALTGRCGRCNTHPPLALAALIALSSPPARAAWLPLRNTNPPRLHKNLPATRSNRTLAFMPAHAPLLIAPRASANRPIHCPQQTPRTPIFPAFLASAAPSRPLAANPCPHPALPKTPTPRACACSSIFHILEPPDAAPRKRRPPFSLPT